MRQTWPVTRSFDPPRIRWRLAEKTFRGLEARVGKKSTSGFCDFVKIEIGPRQQSLVFDTLATLVKYDRGCRMMAG